MQQADPDNAHPPSRTHLFALRVWLEDLGEGQTEWRGEVHHVISGEIRYFRNWPALAGLLEAMLPKEGRDLPDIRRQPE
jgi:hypothetical protein